MKDWLVNLIKYCTFEKLKKVQSRVYDSWTPLLELPNKFYFIVRLQLYNSCKSEVSNLLLVLLTAPINEGRSYLSFFLWLASHLGLLVISTYLYNDLPSSPSSLVFPGLGRTNIHAVFLFISCAEHTSPCSQTSAKYHCPCWHSFSERGMLNLPPPPILSIAYIYEVIIVVVCGTIS